MLLAIDIGNTNINLGLFRGGYIVKKFFIPTQQKSYKPKLKKIFSRFKIDDVIICSVVPNATGILAGELKIFFNGKPCILGEKNKVPIKNLYRDPSQVGQDRLVNAYAAVMLYGVPAIVVDFGTAITFDAISKRAEYLGGMILPGLAVSLDALSKKTALLPKVTLKVPKELIGKDTKNSMLSGIVFGFSVLADGLVIKLKEKAGGEAVIIGTGGDVDLIRNYCRQFDAFDKDLTLKGLYLVYRNTVKKS